MTVPIPYAMKRILRVWDSRFARKTVDLSIRGFPYKFYQTFWWGDISQALIDEEIGPYFAALEDNLQLSVILDVGAAAGHFAIPAGATFPRSTIHAFEPSERQRILLQRNVQLNRVTNVVVESRGLWKTSDTLAFRTNGAESSFASVSRFRGKLPFREMVPVISLDEWIREKRLDRVDLIKMDAEGAEIEVLEGATETLAAAHPRMMIQAYHLRDGVRTFQKCAEILEKEGYVVEERPQGSGFLYAH